MEKIIICIFGKKQSGKTTSFRIMAENLPMFYIQKFSFADKLKCMVEDLFNVDYSKLIGTDEEKNSETHLYWKDVSDYIKESFFGKIKININKKITHRELLQLVGTNLMRAVKEDIWVENTMRQIKVSNANICVLDDARFKNELEAIRDIGGKLIKIYSVFDLKNDNHASEKEFDNIPDDYFDFVIPDYNKKRTIKQLKNKWLNILNKILGEKKC